jgi:pimeloyl-ACP methyl ester carboxylesterase
MEFQILESNGIKIRAAVEGDGPLIIMVHGCPESWYSWRHQISVIANAGYKVAAIDVRGYGGSDKPHPIAAYTLKNISADIMGVIGALGYDDAILFGHDWGGPIVHNTALLNESKITAVAGLSVPYFPRGDLSTIELFKAIYEGKFFYQLYFQEEGVAEQEFEADIRKYLESTYFSIDGRGMKEQFENPLNAMEKSVDSKYLDGVVEFDNYPDWITKEEMDYYIGEFEGSGMRGPLNRYRAQEIDFEDFVEFKDQKLKQPAAFITGSLDPVNFFVGSGYKDSMDLKNQIQDRYENLLAVELVDGVGHWVQEEKPTEVNEFLLNFLEIIKR